MKITHKSGDCGYYIYGNTHDVFAVTHDDGSPIAEVRFDYETDDTNFKMTLEQGSHAYVATLDGCCGELHFTMSVMSAVLKRFTDDHEMYYEGFYHEETGESIEVEFVLVPL
jgi:hypothetical protein